MTQWIDWVKMAFGVWAVVQSLSYALWIMRQKNYTGAIAVILFSLAACFMLGADYYQRYV